MARTRKQANQAGKSPPRALKRIVRVLALLCLAICVLWVVAELWVRDGNPDLPARNASLGFVDTLLVQATFGAFWILWIVALLTGVGVLAAARRAERVRRPILLWVGCLLPPIVLGSVHTLAIIAAQRAQVIESTERTYILVAPGVVGVISVGYALLAGLAAASLAYVVMYGGGPTRSIEADEA